MDLKAELWFHDITYALWLFLHLKTSKAVPFSYFNIAFEINVATLFLFWVIAHIDA